MPPVPPSHGAPRPLDRLLGVLAHFGRLGERAARAVRAAEVQARRRTRQLTFGPRRAAAGGWDEFVEWFGTLDLSENAVLLAFAVVIGAAAALGVVGFYSLVDLSDALFIRWPGARVEALRNPAYRPLLTALGFVAAVSVMRRWAPREEGLNVPDLKRRVKREGGVVPLQPLAARSVSSAVTLGAGGSVGAEGPAAVLGGGLGSVLSRAFRFSRDRTRLLVAAGTAAGISAAFNAPLAGAFFALEEVLGGLQVAAFPTVVVASVVASVISTAVFGVHPAFPVPNLHPSRSWFELLALPPLLGLACGLVTVVFVRTYFGVGEAVARSPLTPRTKAALGGATVGLMVWLSNGLLLGPGHLAIPAEVFGGVAWYVILALCFAKIVATALTLGTGGSGGLFAPSMYVGAATGAALAGLLGALLPSLGVQPAAWAFVAMGGVVGAATGAPITAILLVFELTDDYALMAPLMLVTGLAIVVARRFERDDLYSGWLRRRGVVLQQPSERDVLARLRVKDAYDATPLILHEHEAIEPVLRRVAFSAQPLFPVVDAAGRLAGILPVSLLAQAARNRDALPALIVGDLLVATPAVSLEAGLEEVVRRLGLRDLAALPVVTLPGGELVGLVTRAHVTRVVERALLLDSGEPAAATERVFDPDPATRAATDPGQHS
ncbi:MAG: chloride channel protein [Gemmatimonadetes bacterium]|nr:chloride channel protein [Gemmatimonadota bacterium]